MTQPGQKILTTGIPGIGTIAKPGGVGVDNNSPEFTLLPIGGGTVTLNGATPVVVADARVKANSFVSFSLKTVGGTVSPTNPNLQTITPGTGFTVAGVAGDTSTYVYVILG